jgi:NAD(P)-dependent dehydrogenase (short-subunit alcohol dehydrogenase family)
MTGKTVLVTGASSGVGLAASLLLAELGARVIMICRDTVRGRFMRNEVAQYAADSPPVVFYADLSSQSQIRSLAAQIHDAIDRIDVLINNAGAIFARHELTEDGVERTFAVNHLAPFLLTSLLLDLVQAAHTGRILTVASEFHSGTLNFENLQGERHYNFLATYNCSKLCNILFTYELTRRLAGNRITANFLSPGPTATRLGDNMSGFPALVSSVMKTSGSCIPSAARRRRSIWLRHLIWSSCPGRSRKYLALLRNPVEGGPGGARTHSGLLTNI